MPPWPFHRHKLPHQPSPPQAKGSDAMPFDLFDAVDPNKIPANATAVAGYIDGPESAWSPEGWDRWKGVAQVHITVLADPDGLAFDAETGNAGNDAVAGAVAGRIGRKLPAWVYTNMDNYADVVRALAAKSVKFLDASEWPTPGAYLWAADPSGNIAAGVWKPGVEPVAIQDRPEGDYDVSTCNVDLRAAPAPPAPAPQPPPEGADVQPPAPLLAKGAGLLPAPADEAVRAMQSLLALRGHPCGAAGADGRFGPNTDSAVRTFQSSRSLTVDGECGPNTWGRLVAG